MLLVRKFDKGDATHLRFLYDVRTAPEVAQFLQGNPPKDYNSHVAWARKSISKSIREFFLLEFGGNLLGYFQLYNFRNKECEVGYAMHPKQSGRGYGNVLVQSSIKEASRRYLDKAVLFVKVENTKAIYLYKKHGFVPIEATNGILKMEIKLCQ